MTKLKDQIEILKRIIRSKQHYMDGHIESGRVTAEKANYEIQCLQDAMKTLADLDALVRGKI